MMRRWKAAIAAAVLAAGAGGFAAGLHFGGGAQLWGVVVSPDGRERVEEYGPTRWQALFAGSSDMPTVLRLASSRDGEPIGADSALIDIAGAGGPDWDGDGVRLGALAFYDRRTGRWIDPQAGRGR